MIIPQIMGCGVPVITTTNTGGTDLIKEGINGFILPIRSPQSITEKLEMLYNNPNLLERMKENANDGNHYSWDSYGERYNNFINSLGI